MGVGIVTKIWSWSARHFNVLD